MLSINYLRAHARSTRSDLKLCCLGNRSQVSPINTIPVARFLFHNKAVFSLKEELSNEAEKTVGSY